MKSLAPLLVNYIEWDREANGTGYALRMLNQEQVESERDYQIDIRTGMYIH